VLLVALTGGIGSGKSTVARMLAARGAVVFDADDLARRAIEPGSPGSVQVVDRFGPDVLSSDDSLDRRALAAVVFADPDARRALEAIVHPEVARLFAEEVDHHRGSDRVVVYQVPLLVETGLAPGFDVVVAVSASEPTRIARVRAERAMTEEAVRERIGAQAGDAQREAVAHHVIRNDGTLDALERQVDVLWRELLRVSSSRP
jgi:dephospho-CoA kinase